MTKVRKVCKLPARGNEDLKSGVFKTVIAGRTLKVTITRNEKHKNEPDPVQVLLGESAEEQDIKSVH